MVPRVVCPTAATVDRIMHLKSGGVRKQNLNAFHIAVSSGEILQTVTLNLIVLTMNRDGSCSLLGRAGRCVRSCILFQV